MCPLNKRLNRHSQRKIDKAIQLAARPVKTAESEVYERLNKAFKLQIVRG